MLRSPGLGMPKLLVVDDDLRSARVIAELLRRSGYVVEVAGGGTEALERVRAEPPDLMVLDYEMPEIDGLTVGHSYTVYAGALNGAVDPSQFDDAVVSLLPEYS